MLIGLIDGLTIPLAITAGLTGAGLSSRTVFGAGTAVTAAYALMMAISGYLSTAARRREGAQAAITIGLFYLVGGLFSLLPYYWVSDPLQALRYAAILTAPALLLSGFGDSRINGANGVTGALRVAITAAVAAFAAFEVASLFR
jgi:VIT1/CCC1 family predicted Fe2+/Mn2+ transporter